MLVLQDDRLLARLDPRHGGEVLDLVHLATGRQLLGRPPFASAEPVAGDLDEETWTASYRGGWQLLVPNAGNVSVVDGARHGFHGRGSNDPWAVVESAPTSARLQWEGHGLRVERRVALEDGALAVGTTVHAAAGPAPFVAVEHVALGLELLAPEVLIELPAGQAFELSEQEGPARPPAGAPRWPTVRLLDGSEERADRWALAQPRSRLFIVADLPEQRARVRNAATAQGLELAWDGDVLRHLWVWHEARTSGGPWDERADILVVEPASVPHSLGLDAARAEGQATVVEPGAPVSWSIRATPFVAQQKG